MVFELPEDDQPASSRAEAGPGGLNEEVADPAGGAPPAAAPLPEAGAGGEGADGGDGADGGALAGSPPDRRSRRRHGRGNEGKHPRWWSWATVIVTAVVIAVLLRLFVVQTFFVPSQSMEPTLLPGDRMLVLKIGYSLQRGAVVVFKHPPGELPGMCSDSSNDDLVKRIIGLPGETISSRGNTVYINGKPLAEPWLPKGQPLGQPITTQKVPAGEYFMMGDNRTDSCDSRRWGPIPGSLIIGRVFLVVWRANHPEFKVI